MSGYARRYTDVIHLYQDYATLFKYEALNESPVIRQSLYTVILMRQPSILVMYTDSFKLTLLFVSSCLFIAILKIKGK